MPTFSHWLFFAFVPVTSLKLSLFLVLSLFLLVPHLSVRIFYCLALFVCSTVFLMLHSFPLTYSLSLPPPHSSLPRLPSLSLSFPHCFVDFSFISISERVFWPLRRKSEKHWIKQWTESFVKVTTRNPLGKATSRELFVYAWCMKQEILGWRKIMGREKKMKVLGNNCFAIQIPQSFMGPFRICLVNSFWLHVDGDTGF